MNIRRLFLFASACGLALAWAACGNFSGKGFFDQNEKVSDCGGFPRATHGLRADPPPYCDAEVLHWSYDPQKKLLSLTDARVELNCCGIHHMTLDWEDGVYRALETDDPENGMRCSCMCVFDFSLEASELPQELIRLRLERRVSDWPEASGVVWEGELDLTSLAGFVIIDTTPSMWCELP